MQDVIEQARKEIAEEDHRKRVDAEKYRLRNKQSLFDKLLPFTIKIERKLK